MKLSFLSIPILILTAISPLGCAPRIVSPLNVPSIQEPSLELGYSKNAARMVRIRVGDFKDSRPSATLAVVDGRRVESSGGVARAVEAGFERYLRSAGARLVDLGGPTIEGEVIDWNARVESSFFSSEAQAVARLKVVVRDTNSKAIYHATFSGESAKQHPIISLEDVRKLLADAMAIAIEAAIRDEAFIEQLSKGRMSY
jgi:hypothetical protein